MVLTRQVRYIEVDVHAAFVVERELLHAELNDVGGVLDRLHDGFTKRKSDRDHTGLQNNRLLLFSSETDNTLNTVEQEGTDNPHPELRRREDVGEAMHDIEYEEDQEQHVVHIPELIIN